MPCPLNQFQKSPGTPDVHTAYLHSLPGFYHPYPVSLQYVPSRFVPSVFAFLMHQNVSSSFRQPRYTRLSLKNRHLENHRNDSFHFAKLHEFLLSFPPSHKAVPRRFFRRPRHILPPTPLPIIRLLHPVSLCHHFSDDKHKILHPMKRNHNFQSAVFYP